MINEIRRGSQIRNSLRKGVTLIELTIVIALLSTTYISISKFIKSYKWYENKVNVDYTGNSIMMFLNRSKQYCKANNCNGLISIDLNRNEMNFYKNNLERIEMFKPAAGIKITRLSGSNSIINIDKSGSTSDAISIYYKDIEGKERRVTIRVGSEYTHAYD